MKIKQLIDSLSASEKRYFKVFVRQHTIGEKNDYMDLFEKLVAAENDADFQKKVSATSYSKHLLVTTTYLQKLILKCLRVYHEDSSASSSFRSLIGNIELLYNKRLYTPCLSTIIKVKKMAYMQELLQVCLQAIHFEKNIYSSLNKISKLEKTALEEKEIYAKIISIDELRLIFEKLKYLVITKGPSQNKKDIDELDLIIKPLIKIYPSKNSFYEQFYYLEAFAIYELGKGNSDKSYEYRKRVIALYNDNSSIIKSNPVLYFSIFRNFLGMVEQQGKYKEATHYLEKMSSQIKLYLKNKKHIDKMELEVLSHQLNIKALTKDFKHCDIIISQMKAKLEKAHNENLEEENLVHQLRMITVLLVLKNFDDSLELVNDILNKKTSHIRIDLQVLIRLLNLILHFELKNYTYLENLINNTLYFFKKSKQQFKLELLVINYIKKILTVKNTKEEQNLLLKLRDDIQLSLKQNLQINPVSGIILNEWINSKLNY